MVRRAARQFTCFMILMVSDASFFLLSLRRQQLLFRELDIKKSRNEHPVLLAVPVDWTKEEHERITQIAFENLNVPGLYIAPQPLLALYGCGSVSGLVVDIGHNMTGTKKERWHKKKSENTENGALTRVK